MDIKEKFNLDGEADPYITMDRAIILAQQLALQDAQKYKDRLGWSEIVWVEQSSEHRDDSYRVVLTFRDPRTSSDSTGRGQNSVGLEEFVFNHTGELEVRQVLQWPALPKGGTIVELTSSPIPMVADSLEVVEDRTKEATEAHIESVFSPSNDARQFFMDLFVLDRDEQLLLEIPVVYHASESRVMGAIQPPQWKNGGLIGVTNSRILFALDGKPFATRPSWGIPYSTALGRPTSQGIELEFRISPPTWRTVFLQSPELRDELVDHINQEVKPHV